MMCVKTVIKSSEIHGIGLFADEDIQEGQIIWKFNPLVDLVLSEEQLESLHPVCRERIEYYSFKTNDGRYVLVCDDNRFINYSSDPNVQDVADIESPSIAKRFIPKGEELTTDYCFDFGKESRNMR